jgi:DNA topoisomerase-3
MAKTLVIAEKPSVGRDLARVLPARGRSTRVARRARSLITWAVGHLVQLAEPEQYDPKFKKWRMADLPIVPDAFKLITRDERSKKQMSVVTKLLKSAEVDRVINACDAGREGELIFAYLFEKAGAKKPVQRLWLSSMTDKAMREAFSTLRPGTELADLEAAARSRSEADWIVGMNATRAATIRPALVVRRRRVAGPRADADARDPRPPRGGDPRLHARAVLARRRDLRHDDARVYEGRLHVGANPRLKTADEATAVVEAVRGQRGTITKLDKAKRTEKVPLLYDLTSLQRDANTRFGFSARRTLGAAQRLYEEHKALTYPRTSSRFLSGT